MTSRRPGSSLERVFGPPAVGEGHKSFTGIGLCQRQGGAIEIIRPGDRVFFEPGENHWHGAVPTRFMAHLAIQEADDSGSPVTWGEHVTDDEYSAAPA